MQKQNPTSLRNGVYIFSPWQPLGYRLFFMVFFLYNSIKLQQNKMQ